MEVLWQYPGDPQACEYLPNEMATTEHLDFLSISPEEYFDYLQKGWRRFGHNLFRPRCSACNACQPWRVRVFDFQATKSQKRVCKRNQDITLLVGTPHISDEKLELHQKFHEARSEKKGWSENVTDRLTYYLSFIRNPFPTEEWQYFLGSKLVGVGYVDRLPHGLSAIYFYHDPDLHRRSLGTYNILTLIKQANTLKFPYLYLGFYIKNSRSMSYKSKFQPAETLTAENKWEIVLEK